MTTSKLNSIFLAFLFSGSSFVVGCSTPSIEKHEYAKLSNTRVYEFDFPRVWNAIEESLKNHPIVKRNPVSDQTLSSLTERDLETDWIEGVSREKYQQFEVNHSLRKTYLQIRYRYSIHAEKVLGGVKVSVKVQEEVNKLNSQGQPKGYQFTRDPDAGLSSDLLDQIQVAVLAG